MFILAKHILNNKLLKFVFTKLISKNFDQSIESGRRQFSLLEKRNKVVSIILILKIRTQTNLSNLFISLVN